MTEIWSYLEGECKLTSPLAKWVECLPVVQETGVQSQVKSYQKFKKWYWMTPCLTLSILRYRSMVKMSSSGKEIVPSPTPWCSSYWKGSLWVDLDYNYQLFIYYTFIDIIIKVDWRGFPWYTLSLSLSLSLHASLSVMALLLNNPRRLICH